MARISHNLHWIEALNPIFGAQVADLAECLVMGYQNGVKRDGMGGNLHVQFAERPANLEEPRLQFTMSGSNLRVPGKGRDAEKEIFNMKPNSRRPGAFRKPIMKLGGGDCGDRDRPGRTLVDAGANSRERPLENVADDVGIEQVAGLHSGSRSKAG